jgi:hypothetical protein
MHIAGPNYQATYVVRWVVAEGAITGLSFTETQRGARFDRRSSGRGGQSRRRIAAVTSADWVGHALAR